MGVKDLAEIFPEWYQEWLFESLEIPPGVEIAESLLKPLFSLNKNWLNENFDHNKTSWNKESTAKAYALYYMSIYYEKKGLIGKSYLNAALIAHKSGKKRNAVKLATNALKELTKKSPDWYKASDIIAANK